MSRVDILEKRMFDVTPTSPFYPIIGPRIARTRIYAVSIAGDAAMVDNLAIPIPGREAQTQEAVNQLNEGAKLVRIDGVIPPGGVAIPATSWILETSPFWIFTPFQTTNPGAAGVFLDQWGKILQIPRNILAGTPETEIVYAKRIISEAINPSQTNFGMARLIDLMLGITGSSVIEASNFINLNLPRFDDNNRYDDGLRYATENIFNAPSFWNCFILFLPVDLPHDGYTKVEINNLVNRNKAAGNRKIATITPSDVFPDQ